MPSLPPRAAIIGLGGLGCPAALALVRAGVRLLLVDDDEVELTNLHRQILYHEGDVGRSKLQAAHAALLKAGAAPEQLSLLEDRILPANALDLVSQVDVVLEGADNFATKFLTADACHLARVPVVHGAAIRWRATAWAVSPQGAPCYRCLFEDLPIGAQQNCDSAGVMGPVVGLAGALMADLALRLLGGDADAYRQIWSYDGLRDQLRSAPVSPRAGCALCGERPSIVDIRERRYTDAAEAACSSSASAHGGDSASAS